MLRVHRDFKGLLKDVQDEYDFLAELNKSLQKVGHIDGVINRRRTNDSQGCPSKSSS